MTSPLSAPDRVTPPWYSRPAIVLPIVGALIVAVALVTPVADTGRNGDSRLTTYSTSPMGGRIFFDLTQRLGFSVTQERAAALPADSGAIIAEMSPVVPLRPKEAHDLLEHVRHGGGLLLMLGNGTRAIAESLHVGIGDGWARDPRPMNETAGCEPDTRRDFTRRFLYTLWPGDRVTLTRLVWRGPVRPDSVRDFISLEQAPDMRHPQPVHSAAGFPLGRGRVVVGSDPDVLRNDAIRICKYALDVEAVRMLEYLRDGDGARPHMVFDEFHQGYGEQRSTMGAISRYLLGESSGRLLFQMLGAGLILLLAAMPRLIPPRDPQFIERRSPLEHVDALGRAYAQVGATRSATARLVRGVRRRLAGGASRSGLDVSDDAFLDRALRDAPSLAEDISIIKKALREPISRRDFALVGGALEQVELSLTRI
ncbi:MAG TPA: DUF4350 domain-containing protein [Gemmatimonadaceae bacterium]|nr:DUF4350 domain-containing protein [Gemmatimonadaceae bacterium]